MFPYTLSAVTSMVLSEMSSEQLAPVLFSLQPLEDRLNVILKPHISLTPLIMLEKRTCHLIHGGMIRW